MSTTIESPGVWDAMQIQKAADEALHGPTMTLRDWFAGVTLASYMATQTAQSQLELAIREKHAETPDEDRRKIAREIIAKRCYLQADAMLAERSKSGL
jgi:hypothetical protein